MTSFPDYITSEYEILYYIGQGAFGKVYCVKEIDTCCPYAMKVVEKSGTPTPHEGDIMLRLNHTHLTNLHECVETRKKVYIVMDYMRGGSLRKRLQRNGKLSENLSKLYFYQMCKAIEYLHYKNITHRDLKPENMLLATCSNKTLLKVSDFGSSINCYNYMYSCVGTKIYLAPEVLRRCKYTSKVDIWSLSAILCECLSGIFPFASQSDIMAGNYSFNHVKWNSVSDCVKSLIKSMFKVDTNRRCNITYILKYSWLQDDYVEDTVDYLEQQYG